MRLSDLAIRQLPHPEKGQKRYRDDQLRGFGVTVGAKTKTYFVMYGEGRNLRTIGKFGEISLADARKEARRLLAYPIAKPRLERLTEARTAYLEECEAKNRASTVSEYRRMLELIPDKPLSQVSRSDLKGPTSHQIMAWRIFFNWCIRNELTDKNPFLHIPTKVNKRDRVLTDEELKLIWLYEKQPFSDLLKLLILTGQRRNQIWRFQPEWLTGDIIRFPTEIMKSNRAHSIPITPLISQYLELAPFKFSRWAGSKTAIDKATGVSDWTIHDLRRTYATIHARIGTPIHVVEALLDHSSGTISGVAAIYIRHDFMKEMKEAVLRYESYLLNLVSP